MEDYGIPICLFLIQDESWINPEPLTPDRPLLSQFNSSHNTLLQTCNPAPYPDGTPHLFEVLWQEATGMPRIEYCPGWLPNRKNFPHTNITECRRFTSSSAQTAAMKQEDLFVRRVSFGILFRKCPHAFIVISSTLSVVMAVLSCSLLLASVVRVCWSVFERRGVSSRGAIVVSPSPASNYQQQLISERRTKRRFKRLENEIRKLQGGRDEKDHRSGPSRADDSEEEEEDVSRSFGKEPQKDVYGSMHHNGEAESDPPKSLQTPVRRRRVSTDDHGGPGPP